MISAGEVGAIFMIKDEASAAIRRIIDELNVLQGAIDRTKIALAELKMPPALTRSISNAARAMARLETTTGSASNKMRSGFANADVAVDRTISRVAVLRAELRAAASAASHIKTGSIGSIRHGSYGGGGSGGAGGVGHGSGLGHLRGKIDGPEGTHFVSTNPLVIGGLVAGAAGYFAFENGMDRQSAENRMREGGVAESDVQRTSREAVRLGNKYGFKAGELIDAANEIRNPLGGIDHALGHLETMTKAMNVLRSLDKTKGSDSKAADEAYDLVKSAEFRNAISPEGFDHAIDSMVRASVGTGGKVTANDWLKFSKYARASLPGLSDQYLYKIVPEMIQEFGGSGAGTSNAALFQQIVSGQMRTTGMNLLEKLGEIDPTKVDYDKNGRIVRLRPGANVKAGEFEENPMLYAANLVHELIAQNITDPKLQRAWEAQIFGNRNAAQLINQLVTQTNRLDRGAAGIGQVLPLDDMNNLLIDKDLKTQWSRAVANFSNLFGQVGSNASGFTGGALDMASGLMGWLTRIASGEKYSYGWEKNQVPFDWALERSRRDEAQILKEGPEAHRAAVMGSKEFAAATQAAPNVNVTVSAPNVKVDVKAMIDGKAVAAAVSSMINVTAARVTNDSNSFDGRQNEQYPDHGFH